MFHALSTLYKSVKSIPSRSLLNGLEGVDLTVLKVFGIGLGVGLILEPSTLGSWSRMSGTMYETTNF